LSKFFDSLLKTFFKSFVRKLKKYGLIFLKRLLSMREALSQDAHQGDQITVKTSKGEEFRQRILVFK